MKTKEEILDEVLSKKPVNYEIEREECLEAMDEYAKEVAIDFAKWLMVAEFSVGIESKFEKYLKAKNTVQKTDT